MRHVAYIRPARHTKFYSESLEGSYVSGVYVSVDRETQDVTK